MRTSKLKFMFVVLLLQQDCRYAIKPNDEREGNICTKEQLEAVKEEGWFPCYYDNDASEYKESVLPTTISPTEANVIASALGVGEVTEQIFSLSGQRLAAPRKGLNIVGGRKVVIK